MTTSSEKPPLFSKWRDWYVVLIAVLIVQVILFTWLSISF